MVKLVCFTQLKSLLKLQYQIALSCVVPGFSVSRSTASVLRLYTTVNQIRISQISQHAKNSTQRQSRGSKRAALSYPAATELSNLIVHKRFVQAEEARIRVEGSKRKHVVGTKRWKRKHLRVARYMLEAGRSRHESGTRLQGPSHRQQPRGAALSHPVLCCKGTRHASERAASSTELGTAPMLPVRLQQYATHFTICTQLHLLEEWVHLHLHMAHAVHANTVDAWRRQRFPRAVVRMHARGYVSEIPAPLPE